MKVRNVIILAISMMLFTGCDDDDTSSATATADCAALTSTLTTDATAFLSSPNDSTVCDTYSQSAQAFVDGGCTLCESGSEACLADGSNSATCCDEMTQDSVDQITTLCTSN